MAREGRSRIWFLLAIVVVLYALMSGVIAVGTADECGEIRAEKHWEFFPPHWDCD